MFLSIHIPVTVSSWEPLLADIPSEDRGDVDLVKLLGEMEDPNTFLTNRPLGQRLMLEKVLGDGTFLVDQIMAITAGVQVLQAFLCIHYYIYCTVHHTLPPHTSP